MIPFKNNDNDNKNNLLIEIINNNILVIKINRNHRRNAIDKNTADKLYQVFKEFDYDEKLDIAILTSRGGSNSFCSGADLKEISKGLDKANRVLSPNETDYAPLGCTRLKLSKPVICSIDGYCVAGGLELALWCDLRICTNTSIFGVYCRRFGVPLIDGGSIRLPRLIGQSRAMDLILTGRSVTAKEALEIGLVNRIVNENEDGIDLLQYSIKLAQEIASFPKTCLRNDRRSVYDQYDLSINDALENEYKLGLISLQNDGVNGSINFTNNNQGKHGSFIHSKL